MRLVHGIPTLEVNDRATLTIGQHIDVVTVTHVHNGGRHMDIRFDSGARLRVQGPMLEWGGTA